MTRRGRSRAVLLAIAALGAIGIGVLLRVTHALHTQENQTIATRFTVRGKQRAPSDILVVAIDSKTFDELGFQWPAPRRYDAKVISVLHRDGARVIGVDLQFTTQTDVADDNALIEAVAHAPGTVLATTSVYHGRTNVFGGNAARFGALVGDTSVRGDTSGVILQMPLEIEGLDTFAWTLAREVKPGLPRPAQVPTWIDYAGPPATVRSIPFWQVYEGLVPASTIRGKIVILGVTDPDEQDLHSTPTSGGGFMSGAELQANAVSTFLRGGPLRSTPITVDLLLIALLGGFAPLSTQLLRHRRRLNRVVPVLGALLYVAASQLAFDAGWIIPIVSPLAALAIGFVLALGVDYVAETFERERIYDMFSRFVPDSVVKEAVAEAGGVRLGGVGRECTVMFSDLRGFTSFSSQHEPKLVIDVVNSYLGEMSDAILDAGGTLVAYMGDGIFAVFGAPIEMPDHADRALAAAREMIGVRLPRFNARLHDMGLKADFRMGVGLNSGTVISGNVGSERRLEYAAIGDTTNVAARIEASTKETPNMLLFSESTRDSLTRPPDDMSFVTEIELRGAGRALKLWTVAGTEGVRTEHTQASVLGGSPGPA